MRCIYRMCDVKFKKNPPKQKQKIISKDNFGEFESTEWSIVFNLDSGEAPYYHSENYGNSYVFTVNEEAQRMPGSMNGTARAFVGTLWRV